MSLKILESVHNEVCNCRMPITIKSQNFKSFHILDTSYLWPYVIFLHSSRHRWITQPVMLKFSLFSLYLAIPFIGLDDFGCWLLTSMQDCWSSLTVCWSLLFVVPAVVLNASLWGIEFKFNNTTTLIVPNKIICLLAQTLPGICISGNPGRRNKETN